MAYFCFEARGEQGIEHGRIDAADSHDAARKLHERGLYVVTLKVDRRDDEPWFDRLLGSADPKSMAIAFRELSVCLESGLSPGRSLAMVAIGMPLRMRTAFTNAERRVQEGEPLSEALGNRTTLFGPHTLALLVVGERSGRLVPILRQIADWQESVWKARQQTHSAMTYPIMLFAATFLIELGRSAFVMGFPWAIAHVLVPWIAYIAAFLAATRLLMSAGHWPAIARVLDTLILMIPLVGTIARKRAAARFARSFAEMFEAGMSPMAAIELAADGCGNRMIGDALHRAAAPVARGVPLVDVLEPIGVLPAVLAPMLRTGEISGQVGTMMRKVADYLDSEAATTNQTMHRVLPVALWFIVAIPMVAMILSSYAQYAGGIEKVTGQP